MSNNFEVIDFEIRHFGSVVMVAALTQESLAWIEANVSQESWQWMGNSLAVDPRYMVSLAEGMQADGLNVI